MQETGWALGKGLSRQVLRVVIGILLFILATGVWVCLWVPPSF